MLCNRGKTEKDVGGLDLSALKPFYPVSFVVALTAWTVVYFLSGMHMASGVAVGCLFGTINISIISVLAVAVLHPVKRNPVIATLTLVLKVPITYGILIALFASEAIDLIGFVIGFQLFFITLFIYLITYQHLQSGRSLKKGDDVG